MLKRFIILIPLLFSVIGCTELIRSFEVDQPAQQMRLQQTVYQLKQDRDATTQALSDLDKKLDAIPDNDPDKAVLKKEIAENRSRLDRMDHYLNVAAEFSKNPSPNNPILDTVAGSFGVWGVLALGIARLGYTELDRLRKQRDLASAEKQLSQVVKSVDVAVPTLTQDQKTKMASVQDRDTQEKVAQIKSQP